ncbi:zf-HC2 domain-containing protein [Actinomadura sp. SCN-SB]|uniref:zf-HC2 domain-containing protein n=1 Tax=Actinomadura sp. SCN-SB TaxID=3373092 RepID=UPI003751C283
MSCLGERLTALVDGELGHDERDRALAHLAGCARCRSEADMLRRLKRRLRGLGDLPASDGADDLPSTDFMARLRGLADTASGPDTPSGPSAPSVPPLDVPPLDASPPRVPVASPLHGRPRTRANRPVVHARASRVTSAHAVTGHGLTAPLYGGVATMPRHVRRRYLAVGAATLVIGLGAASYAAGGQREVPTVSPAFDRFAVEHALTSGDVPMGDPVDHGSSVPPVPEP